MGLEHGRVLVLGATGMLGHKVLQRLQMAGIDAAGTVRGRAEAFADHSVLGGMRLVGGVDAGDFDTVVRAVAAVRPTWIVNAVGLVKQLPGGKTAIPSITMNSLMPHRVGQLAQAVGARFVQVSTDCVFSGRDGGYTESSVPDAEDLYGRSKLLGEVDGPGLLTLRTSIVGRQLTGASSLFEWFISNRSPEGAGAVKGFTRAIYTGVTTSVLGDVIAKLVRERIELDGVWQVASEPISKHGLLVMLNEAMDLGIEVAADESFACDRSLNGSAFAERVGWSCPTWQQMIDELAADPTPYDEVRGEARAASV